MLEIKVQCDCGQKYKFDVEPVNGRMPHPVHCPVCNLEGTEKANTVLFEQKETTPPAPVLVGAAVAPVVSGAPRLRIGGSAHSVSSASAPPPISPATPGTPPPIRPGTPAPMRGGKPAQTGSGKPGNLSLGVVGAIAGGIVGAVAIFFIYKAIGFRFGFIVGIGIGALTGYGAKLLGRCHTPTMGAIAAAVALVCIFGTHYMKARSIMRLDNSSVDSMYEEEMKEARDVIKEMPNGTEDEIKQYLAKETVAEGEKPNLSQITTEEVKSYHDFSWVKNKDLVDGKTTKDDYRKTHNLNFVTQSIIGKVIFWVLALGIFNLFSTCVGVGLAYKLGTGEK
ncbi:MAG: hypothetical protein QOD03_510 [Verrucomicrobiota bacterium]|jgi:hypothetical protein